MYIGLEALMDGLMDGLTDTFPRTSIVDVQTICLSRIVSILWESSRVIGVFIDQIIALYQMLKTNCQMKIESSN